MVDLKSALRRTLGWYRWKPQLGSIASPRSMGGDGQPLIDYDARAFYGSVRAPGSDQIGRNFIGNSFTAVAPGSPYTNLLADGVTPTPQGASFAQMLDWGGGDNNVIAGGAVVNGATDDKPALALAATKGGSVLLARGTSAVGSAWNVGGSPLLVHGRGKDVSFLKGTGGFPVVQLGTSTTLADLTIDANSIAGPGGAVQLNSPVSRWTIRGVRVLNSAGSAMRGTASDGLITESDIEGSATTGIELLTSSTRNRIIANRIDTVTTHGILSGSSGTRTIVGFNIISNAGQIALATGNGGNKEIKVGNYIQASLDNAIDIAGGSDLVISSNIGEAPAAGIVADNGNVVYPAVQSAVLVTGNIMGNTTWPAHGASAGYGFAPRGQDGVWNSNIGHDLGGYGAYLKTVDNHVLVGNLIKNASRGAAGKSGIFLESSGGVNGGVLLVGNRSFDDAIVKSQTYGLEIPFGARWVYAAHNDFRGNLTGAISNDGRAGAYTHGNAGYNPVGVVAFALPAIGTLFSPPGDGDGFVVITGGTVTNISVGGLPAPANWPGVLALFNTSAVGGTLAGSTTFGYRVAARNTAGHTVECAEVTITTPAGTNTNLITLQMPPVAGSWSFDIYGRTPAGELLMASNWAKKLFIDDGSVVPSGAMPGTDTTGNTALGLVPPLVLPYYYGVAIKFTGTVNPTCIWFQN